MQLDAVIRRKKSGSGISGPVSDEEELELSFCNERLQAELDALSRTRSRHWIWARSLRTLLKSRRTPICNTGANSNLLP